MEEELFHKCICLPDKLIEYGFLKEGESYRYSKNILKDSFQVRVVIEDGKVSGCVWDFDMDTEYIGYRIEKNLGEFAGKVREEYLSILRDIRDHCFLQRNFVSEQANRISEKIFKIYGDHPYFEWESTPDCGVFKNKESHKWYAIVMNIKRSKIEDHEGMVDVMNVKLDDQMIPTYLKKEGVFPAYHMNKKYWVSLALDERLTDDEILSFIKESYQYTVPKKK